MIIVVVVATENFHLRLESIRLKRFKVLFISHDFSIELILVFGGK